MERRSTRVALTAWTALVVLFLWIPLALIVLYAFNKSNVESWPIQSLTTHWFHTAWNSEVRSALWLSVRVGVTATGIALVLGSMAAFGVARFRFFGRETVSFLLVLPIALPGIVTGIALNSAFLAGHILLSTWTIIVGHATFCVIVVYNNVLARLRRSSPSLIEASQDLGADGWQTFRFVIWPVLSTALVAGGLRRGRRHVLHGRCAEHAPAAHLRLHPPRPAASGRQRDRLRDDPPHGDPRAARAAARARHRGRPRDRCHRTLNVRRRTRNRARRRRGV
jgi:putative spermidine/putrescine transport system permease protein